MKRDLCIIPDDDGAVNFDLVDAQQDSGLLLLQRIWTLLLTRGGSMRDGSSVSVLQFLDGSNWPSDDAMDSLLIILQNDVLRALDPEDRGHIDNLNIYASSGTVVCELRLTDGTTISGTLGNG